MSFKDKSNTPYSSLTKFLFLVVIIGCSVNSQGQISGGEIESKDNNKKEKKEKKENVERDSLSGITYYLTGFGQYAYRKFEDQSVYGIYEKRNDEIPTRSYGGNFGVLMDMGNGISLDIGMSYFGHGEEYLFDDPESDSTFHYKRTYMQLGIPLKIRYSYGEKFQVFGFAGVMPLNILNVRYDQDYTTEEGIGVDSELQLNKDGFTQFNVMASAGLGFNYNLDYFGFTIYPEYRHYLINTFADVSIPLNHKMYGFALHAGVLLRL